MRISNTVRAVNINAGMYRFRGLPWFAVPAEPGGGTGWRRRAYLCPAHVRAGRHFMSLSFIYLPIHLSLVSIYRYLSRSHFLTKYLGPQIFFSGGMTKFYHISPSWQGWKKLFFYPVKFFGLGFFHANPTSWRKSKLSTIYSFEMF